MIYIRFGSQTGQSLALLTHLSAFRCETRARGRVDWGRKSRPNFALFHRRNGRI